MPRYFLNLFNGANTIDEEGAEFADLAAARSAAVGSARELMAENLVAGRPIDLNHRIEIADETGQVVGVVAFRDAVTIQDG